MNADDELHEVLARFCNVMHLWEYVQHHVTNAEMVCIN